MTDNEKGAAPLSGGASARSNRGAPEQSPAGVLPRRSGAALAERRALWRQVAEVEELIEAGKRDVEHAQALLFDLRRRRAELFERLGR